MTGLHPIFERILEQHTKPKSMTTEQLENNIAAMRAEHDEKPWQSRIVGSAEWMDQTPGEKVDDFEYWEHRAKPEPKLRPWTRDEVPVGSEVRDTLGNRGMIVGVDARRLFVAAGSIVPYTYKEVLEKLKLADGQPCGVIES